VKIEGTIVACAFAIKPSAPVEKVVSWFHRFVCDEGGLRFAGSEGVAALRDYEPEYHVVAGTLESSSTGRTLTPEQVGRVSSWIDSEHKHLGVYFYTSALTAEDLADQRRHDPAYPGSRIGVV
jgi:hypothetical protein